MSLTRRELLIGGAILFGAGAATAFAGVELKKNLTNPSENDSIFPENQLLDWDYLDQNQNLLINIASKSKKFPITEIDYSDDSMVFQKSEEKEFQSAIARKGVKDLSVSYNLELGFAIVLETDTIVQVGTPYQNSNRPATAAFLLAINLNKNEKALKHDILDAYTFSTNGNRSETQEPVNGLILLFDVSPSQLEGRDLVLILNKDIKQGMASAEVLPVRLKLTTGKSKRS